MRLSSIFVPRLVCSEAVEDTPEIVFTVIGWRKNILWDDIFYAEPVKWEHDRRFDALLLIFPHF